MPSRILFWPVTAPAWIVLRRTSRVHDLALRSLRVGLTQVLPRRLPGRRWPKTRVAVPDSLSVKWKVANFVPAGTFVFVKPALVTTGTVVSGGVPPPVGPPPPGGPPPGVGGSTPLILAICE